MPLPASRWLLWGALILVLPLPFYLVETGLAPAARLWMLTGVVLALIASEGSLGVAGVIASLLIAQATAYTALLWWLADPVSRLLARAAPQRATAATAVLVAAALVAAASFDLYHTPFRTRSLRADLLEIFE